MKLIEGLQSELKLLPSNVLSVVHEIVDSPYSYHTVQDIAIHAEIRVLKLYRIFASAGLGSPRRFLNAVKVLTAVGYLEDRGYSIRDVAKKSAIATQEHWLSIPSMSSG